MRLLCTQFLLAAALLGTTTAVHGARFFTTSPLIQIGDDTDIFFDGSVSLGVNDNLFSSENKVSGTSFTFTPGFTIEYAKDSPLYVTATAQRSKVSYYGGGNLSRLNNSQDLLDGTVYIDQGGPLKLTLRSNYRESARNDNLTSLGIDNKVLGETLVRQGNYSHSFKVDYRVTEKVNTVLTLSNSYNRYLNPTKLLNAANETVFNTNSLSEINTKSVMFDVKYNTPGDKMTYGFVYTHDLNDFTPAPYYKDGITVRSKDPSVLDAFRIYKSTKDFYGLTAYGKLTSSGKLSLDAKLGFSSSDTSEYGLIDSKLSGLSFSINLKHALTEVISHELSLNSSTSPTPNGADSKTKTYGYTINYALDENLIMNFHIVKSDVNVGSSTVNTMDYNLGAMYSYNNHLNFTATIDSLQTQLPGVSFQSNSFLLQATLRY